jgi:hypothetical protein
MSDISAVPKTRNQLTLFTPPLDIRLTQFYIFDQKTTELSTWKFIREDPMEQRRPDKLPVTGSSQVLTRSWEEHG